MRDPLGFLQRLKGDYGDLCSFRVGTRRIVQLSHPDYVREFFVMQHDKLRKTGLMKQAEPVLGEGLFLSEGELHRKQRRRIQPVFNRQHIGTYAPIIVRTIVEASDKWKDETTIDLFAEMSELSLTLTTRTLFGTDLPNQGRVQQSVKTVVGHFNSFLRPRLGIASRLPTRRNRQFRSALSELNNTVSSIVRNCGRQDSSGKTGSILSILLNQSAQVECTEGNSDKLIRDEIRTLLVAGHETVATAITWAFYLIAKHPNVEERLIQEWRNVLSGRDPSYDDFESLNYTRMVLAESMRLYPPVWGISRVTTEDFSVGGYMIPAKCILGVSPFVVHRDDRYFPDPMRFDPDRWLPEQANRRPRFSYFPFGGGPRLCIGEPLAWLELTIMLAIIGQHWRFQLIGPAPVRMRPLVTLRPLDVIQLVVNRRKNIDHDSLTKKLTGSASMTEIASYEEHVAISHHGTLETMRTGEIAS